MRIRKFEVLKLKSIVGAMACAPMLFAIVVGCSPSSNEIQSPKCVGGNANCDLPSMTVGVGSDSETSSSGASNQHTVNNDSEFDPITIKTLRFGETSVIEFIFENPKLIPLKFSSLTLDRGSTDFTEVAGVTEKDCHDNRIYYQQ